ncbi:hypothetical protein A1D17_03735 [Pseudomonas fluorescens]|uniref:Uncharacterized protein n=1 Tax=Pseudomonas fluorescens TaxID=294 RepID=A0A166QPZ8_PSEFL|nr:hypothetical protein A1D17_03735 [Pseudomonas fluorescens]
MSLSVGHTSLIRGMFIFCLVLELGNRALKLYLQLTPQDEQTHYPRQGADQANSETATPETTPLLT